MKIDVHKRTSSRAVHFDVVTGLLRGVDVFSVTLAGALAYFLYLQRWPIELSYSLVIATGGILAATLQNYLGIYRFDALRRPFWQTGRLMLGVLLAFLLLAALGFATKSSDTFSRGWVAIWLALAAGSYLLVRLLLLAVLKRGRESGWLVRNFVVIGSGEIAERFLARFLQGNDPHSSLIGIFHDAVSGAPPNIHGFPILGPVSDLREFAQVARIDEVVIALPLAKEPRLIEIIEEARLLAADVRLIATDLAFEFSHRPITQVAGIPAINLADRPVSKWNSIGKALEDRLLAALLLLILAAPIALIALLVKLDDPGPVLFRQKRFGLNGRLFDLYKFRTMYTSCEDPYAEQLTRPNDDRVTRIGAFLRAWSLDELPQLINVLKGEMSLVGPRPHALSAKAAGKLYEEAVDRYRARHRIKPGMTGWAQVNGWRGETDTIEKIQMRVKYDLEYIENWSLLFDLKILLQTVLVVLLRWNAY